MLLLFLCFCDVCVFVCLVLFIVYVLVLVFGLIVCCVRVFVSFFFGVVVFVCL